MIAINNQVRHYFGGVDLLASAGQTYLTSEVQEQHLNPSDIAHRLCSGMTNKSVNLLLTKVGLQTASRDAKSRIVYDLTETGKQFGEYMDTGKKHSDGRPVRQIRWCMPA